MGFLGVVFTQIRDDPLGAKIMLKHKYNTGFTLIEIVAILILIGILMAVAASKYFDMRDEAQKRAALATVAEAQSRINSVFAEKILGGDSCTVARDYASKLENIADGNSAPYVFGDYYLEKAGTEVGDSDVFKVNVGLISETPERTITTATLYLPECGSKNNPPSPVDPIWYWDEEKIRNEFGVVEFIPTDNIFNSIEALLRVIRETINTSGTIFKIKTLGGTVLLEKGYYVSTDFLEIKGDLIVGLNAAEDNWVRYDSDGQEWVKYNSSTQQWVKSSPKSGNYYLDSEENAVYIFKGYGDANNPNSWLKFNDTTP